MIPSMSLSNNESNSNEGGDLRAGDAGSSGGFRGSPTINFAAGGATQKTSTDAGGNPFGNVWAWVIGGAALVAVFLWFKRKGKK